MLPLDITTILAVTAFLLIAWDASRTEKNPLVVLAGFVLLLAAVVTQVFSKGGFAQVLLGFFFDVGVGLAVASLILALKKGRYGPFLALGILALLIAGTILGGMYLMREAQDRDYSALIELGPDDRIEEVFSVLNRYDIHAEKAFPSITTETDIDLAQVYLLTGNRYDLEDALTVLRNDTENVDHAAWNERVYLDPPERGNTTSIEGSVLANDPLASSQWALSAIHVHEAHQLLQKVEPVRKAVVAIIDTGVDAGHEDLTKTFGKSPITVDENGHGTHCAGIAGAVANNNVGIASLNWDGRFVEVKAYRALGATGVGTHESIAQAIIDAATGGADVLSISLGDHSPVAPKVIRDAIAFAFRKGAIVVASAGNADRDARDHMPSNIEGVIAVAAVDQGLQKARFSNTVGGLSRPIAAPGVDILSLRPGNKYVALNGTSMATPHVSGLIGVLRALNPQITAEEAYDILRRTGTPVQDSERVGNLINTAAAIRAVREVV